MSGSLGGFLCSCRSTGAMLALREKSSPVISRGFKEHRFISSLKDAYKLDDVFVNDKEP